MKNQKKAADRKVLSTMYNHLVVSVRAFRSGAAQLHEQSAFLGYADITLALRACPDSPLCVLPNIAVRLTSNVNPYLAMPSETETGERYPFFRPASAEFRTFLTDAVFADASVKEVADKMRPALERKLADGTQEQPAQQVRSSNDVLTALLQRCREQGVDPRSITIADLLEDEQGEQETAPGNPYAQEGDSDEIPF